ncbi:MAG TPA: acylphosphatase, partial [Caldisericia bacterium]|nr:acylphosphatase [Caldisericia bacterium]
MQKRLQVVIEGVIQGVGFRPFIYKVAKSFDLKGFVFNTSDVVNIEVQGEEENLNNFIKEVIENPPPAAKIAKIGYVEIHLKDDEDFQITNSVVKNPSRIYIPKDLCVCKDCINELFDPENRRYLYPFINCTNCGPRYSIIEHLPYDRENTTMSDFQMCNDCLEEYNNPQTRRYHAEPNACEKCGPEVLLFDSSENFIASSKDAIELCKKLLEEGNIVAIKGIGGFHLAANAYNDESVFRLRQSKKRGNEPFAIMMPDIESIKEIAYVSSEEKEE